MPGDYKLDQFGFAPKETCTNLNVCAKIYMYVLYNLQYLEDAKFPAPFELSSFADGDMGQINTPVEVDIYNIQPTESRRQKHHEFPKELYHLEQ